MPLPDVGTITDGTKTAIQTIHDFYVKREFTVIPPTSMQDLQADSETVYAMLGEDIWKMFFEDHNVEEDDALPTQLHSILAYQARLSVYRLARGNKGGSAKGEKGEGKGKKDNVNY